jgi:hypothetical protein
VTFLEKVKVKELQAETGLFGIWLSSLSLDSWEDQITNIIPLGAMEPSRSGSILVLPGGPSAGTQSKALASSALNSPERSGRRQMTLVSSLMFTRARHGASRIRCDLTHVPQ